MHQRTLQDLAKFGAGLVAADLFSLLWYARSGFFPPEFLGLYSTTDTIVPSIVFDGALFILLVHYGWHIGKIPRLHERRYLIVAGTIFSLVAVVHLARIFMLMPLELAGWVVPLWLSWFAVIVAAYMAYSSLIFAVRMGRK